LVVGIATTVYIAAPAPAALDLSAVVVVVGGGVEVGVHVQPVVAAMARRVRCTM
jgi:hypothetical protein